MQSLLDHPHIRQLVSLALAEDLGGETTGLQTAELAALAAGGDVTTRLLIPQPERASARIIAKEPMTVCGLGIAQMVFRTLDPAIVWTDSVGEGSMVERGAVLATLSGSLQAILSGERTALNFLQRLSAIATQTAFLVKLVAHTQAKLLDTRKTTPGLRLLEKYAVSVGGGHNHRIGLFDQVLIKNNHIDALEGDVARAVGLARAGAPAGMLIEVEVRTLDELRGAMSADPDIILFDNMSPDELRIALGELWAFDPDRHMQSEASGGITVANLVPYAETGVDRISLGALTHSVRAADISLRFTSSAKKSPQPTAEPRNG